jgi:6-pyruvoyltetrahydropterin/6-carboxytetrahydropterin synthase
MPTSLTRVVQFGARHRMRVAGWSEAQNRQQFGPLSDFHHHDYRCGVTVTGPVDPAMGMVMDLGDLDRILAEEVLRFAGTDLNDAVPAFAGGTPLPTCEALAEYLYRRVAGRLPPGVRLERVRVAEDDTLHADCTGAA